MTDDEKHQLDKAFSEIANRVWTSKIVKPDDAIPELFHYTNAAGLLGILRSRSLWATHFQSLNDASEMHYGMKQVRDLINAKKEIDEKRFLLSAMGLLDAAFIPVGTPYVVSFCPVGDLLSQWREYGDRGSGFSIGFDFIELSGIFGTGTSVLKIEYRPNVQLEILSDTLDAAWSILQLWESKCGQQRFTLSLPSAEGTIEDHCRWQLVSLLLGECATFKNPGFREEQELRLVRLGEGDSPRKFRTGRFGMVPYIELSPPSGQKLPIKKIMQGPTADPTAAGGSVQMLLEDYGYADVSVEVSTIPLR